MNEADWQRFVRLASDITRGGAAARRLSATAELIGNEVPDILAAFASDRVPRSKDSVIYLDDRSLHGRRGKRLERWQLVANSTCLPVIDSDDTCGKYPFHMVRFLTACKEYIHAF